MTWHRMSADKMTTVCTKGARFAGALNPKWWFLKIWGTFKGIRDTGFRDYGFGFRVSQNNGYLFGGPDNKDYNIYWGLNWGPHI